MGEPRAWVPRTRPDREKTEMVRSGRGLGYPRDCQIRPGAGAADAFDVHGRQTVRRAYEGVLHGGDRRRPTRVKTATVFMVADASALADGRLVNVAKLSPRANLTVPRMMPLVRLR
jgi:hypothetical protein